MGNRCQDDAELLGDPDLEETSHDTLDALSESRQERLVTILDQYLIDIEEGRRVDVPALLEQNADIAGPLQHYLDGLQLVRELSRTCDTPASNFDQGDLLHSVSLSPHRVFPQRISTSGSSAARRVGRAGPAGCPAQLGPYELGEIIGRGAMGIVYRAYDKRHQREVAVKVLAFGNALDASRIDRFRREAKTAAALEHPNVVPVYAVGCEAGINYYAMQLIEGASLDRRLQAAAQHASAAGKSNVGHPCDQRASRDLGNAQADLAAPLLGSDRYRRVAQWCAAAAGALHAAHCAGVIHRDVKPSNLLVGKDGQLWVTDFGLARVQTENGLTQTGELIGTVRYMSPEQASGQGALIDARTDVYGLGAALYELVTGQPPYPSDDMLDVLRQIQTSEPPSPHQIDPHIPRNLETIIRRAMRPRPSDRYPTAAAMAEDLARFAAGAPILAHAVSPTERCIGWTLRHRRLALGLVTAWASILAVALISVGLLWQAQTRTVAALEKSESHYRQARNIVDTLGSSVARRLATIPAAEALRHDILADTIDYYEQFIADSARDPRLTHDVAQTRLELARLTALADGYTPAESAYQAVLAPYGINLPTAASSVENVSKDSDSPTAAKFPDNLDETLLCVQALNEWGLLAAEHGRPALAQQRFQKALQCLALPTATDLAEQRKLALAGALTHNNLGVVSLQLGQPSASARELKCAIDILTGLPAEMLRTEELGREVADAFSNLSVLLGEAKQYEAATQAAEQSLALRRQTLPAEVAEHQGRLAITYNNLAANHWKAGQTAAAIEAYQAAAKLLDQAIREAPRRADNRQRLAVTLNNLGMALVSQNGSSEEQQENSHLAQAGQVFQRAEALAQQAVAADPDDAQAVRHLAGIQNNQAIFLRQQQRFSEANEKLRSAASLIQSLPAAAAADNQDMLLLRQIEQNQQSAATGDAINE